MPAEPGSTPPAPPKTLPHALSRAAKAGALNVGLEDRLGKTLNTYSEAMEKASLDSTPESCIYRARADSGCLWDDTGRRCSTAARPRDRRHFLDPLASHLVVFDRARHEGQGERQDGEVGIGRRSVCVSCCISIAKVLCVLIEPLSCDSQHEVGCRPQAGTIPTPSGGGRGQVGSDDRDRYRSHEGCPGERESARCQVRTLRLQLTEVLLVRTWTARTSAKLVKPRQRPAHLLQHGRRDPLGTS
jgi:hypothetical protein